MISQQQIKRLQDALNTSLMLNVPDLEGRKNIAVAISQALNLVSVDQFVKNCIKE